MNIKDDLTNCFVHNILFTFVHNILFTTRTIRIKETDIQTDIHVRAFWISV